MSDPSNASETRNLAHEPPRSVTRVAVVVPVHNAPEFVARLRWQLSALEHPVVWVDDASGPETASLVSSEPHYLRNIRQQLFTRTANRGLRHAYRRFSPQYLAVVNTDCDLRDGWLDSLIDILDSNPRIGIVGYDNVCPSYPRPFLPIGPPGYVTGHCMAVRAKMLEEVGVFCETDVYGINLPHTRGLQGLAHIGSDHLLSLRAMERGWEVGYCCKDLVGHAISRSWPGGIHWLSQFRLEPLWTADDSL